MKIDSSTCAVVVGGASGMGAASVRALRARGAGVAILDRDSARGSVLATEVGACFVAVDVTDEESVVQAFDAARRAQGQERILIATPGGGGLGYTAWRDAASGDIRRHDIARFEHIVRLNLTGTFLCASVAAAGMMTLAPAECGNRGVILMTSSVASQARPPQRQLTWRQRLQSTA